MKNFSRFMILEKVILAEIWKLYLFSLFPNFSSLVEPRPQTFTELDSMQTVSLTIIIIIICMSSDR
jgi:hypothetical protein